MKFNLGVVTNKHFATVNLGRKYGKVELDIFVEKKLLIGILGEYVGFYLDDLDGLDRLEDQDAIMNITERVVKFNDVIKLLGGKPVKVSKGF